MTAVLEAFTVQTSDSEAGKSPPEGGRRQGLEPSGKGCVELPTGPEVHQPSAGTSCQLESFPAPSTPAAAALILKVYPGLERSWVLGEVLGRLTLGLHPALP